MITTRGKITKLDEVTTAEQANESVSTSPPFAIRHSTAVEQFTKKAERDSSMTEAHRTRFLKTMSYLENHRGSYTFRDAVIFGQWFLEIGSVEMLRALFDDYTSCLVQHGRLSVLENLVSDETVFIIQ